MKNEAQIIPDTNPLMYVPGPAYLAGERDALKQVVMLGRCYGFGNLIAELKRVWAQDLVARYRIPPEEALRAADVSAYTLNFEEIEEAILQEAGYGTKTKDP